MFGVALHLYMRITFESAMRTDARLRNMLKVFDGLRPNARHSGHNSQGGSACVGRELLFACNRTLVPIDVLGNP
jgi:hypothetical protein